MWSVEQLHIAKQQNSTYWIFCCNASSRNLNWLASITQLHLWTKENKPTFRFWSSYYLKCWSIYTWLSSCQWWCAWWVLQEWIAYTSCKKCWPYSITLYVWV